MQYVSWAVADLAGASFPEEIRRTIFHEGVRWYLSGAESSNPVWIEEGLTEVFSTFEIAKRQAEWGQAIPEHVSLLRSQSLRPLARLVCSGREELFGKDLNHTEIVYAQTWAFLHFLVFGQHTIPPAALADDAALSGTRGNGDEAFHRATSNPAFTAAASSGGNLARRLAGWRHPSGRCCSCPARGPSQCRRRFSTGCASRGADCVPGRDRAARRGCAESCRHAGDGCASCDDSDGG